MGLNFASLKSNIQYVCPCDDAGDIHLFKPRGLTGTPKPMNTGTIRYIAGVAMILVSNIEISLLHLLTQMREILIKWCITTGYDTDFPILAGCQNRIGKLPIWENMEKKKKMKKDNQY